MLAEWHWEHLGPACGESAHRGEGCPPSTAGGANPQRASLRLLLCLDLRQSAGHHFEDGFMKFEH